MMIAGPNLTIDRTLSIDELRPGEVLRFERAVVSPGGKGVNVARVARELGAGAVLVGFVPGRTGAAAAALLADEGVVVARRRGRRRAALDRCRPGTLGARDGLQRAGAAAGARRLGALRGGGGATAWRASGSWRAVDRCRRGAPDDAYARLVALARGVGALAVVDVGGSQLAAALAAGADVVTPNLAEAEGLLHGRADETVETGDPVVVRERALAAARALVERGARRAVVTAAAAGAAVADGVGGVVGGRGCPWLLCAIRSARGMLWSVVWRWRWSAGRLRGGGGCGDGVRGGERGDGCRGRGGARAGGGVARWSDRCVGGAACAYSITEGKRSRGGATVRGRPPRGRATRTVLTSAAPGRKSQHGGHRAG